MRAGNIDFEVQRARLDAEADYYGQPMSATANTLVLIGCWLLLLFTVAGVKVAKAWGYLS